MKRMCILAGDQPAAAQHIAASLGIDPAEVFAGVKPAGKADMIARLKQEGRNVAMVGDGINDATALATAHVGIAMGGGVGAASQVASIVLLGDRLPQVRLTRCRQVSAQTATMIAQLFACRGVQKLMLMLCAHPGRTPFHILLHCLASGPCCPAWISSLNTCRVQTQVLDAIHTSKATFRKIRQNLGWAFTYNVVAIPVAAGALLPSAGIAFTPSLAGMV